MFKRLTSVISALILTLGFGLNPAGGVCPENLSLDEKIGQMMCLDLRLWYVDSVKKPVTEITPEIKEVISNYHIGSVILFSENFANKEQAKKLIHDLKKAATDSGNPPLIICVDQEGGKVERFAFDRKRLKDNSEIKTPQEAFEKGQIIGKELQELGIDCDFAPVVDVNSNPMNPIINVRSFGSNPDIVSALGKSFVDGLHSQNIISTAKHFPGHGDTCIDSHVGLPRVNKSLEELENMELKPFKSVIDSGVDLIMTAHIELPKIEGSTVISKKDGRRIFLPATLSKKVLTGLLRNNMNFKGVIVTDAMNMKAISENFGEEEAVKLAIKAGADMVCMPTKLISKKDLYKLDAIYKSLKCALDNNEISEKQINESVSRLLKLKEKYCH